MPTEKNEADMNPIFPQKPRSANIQLPSQQRREAREALE
jgi:hypothetical protein